MKENGIIINHVTFPSPVIVRLFNGTSTAIREAQLEILEHFKMSEEITKADVPTSGENIEAKVSKSVAEPKISSTKLSGEQTKKLSLVIQAIPGILKGTENPEYDEMYGYRINVDTEEYVDVAVRDEILLKFLIANEYNVEETKKKIISALNWRHSFNPLSAAYDESFDERLTSLGLLTNFEAESSNMRVVTWNLYGNLKDPKDLFEKYANAESALSSKGTQFLRWRIGLMEKALLLVDFADANNNKIAQIHDYKGVSMFRMDPNLKAATKQIISIFGDNYPELLSIKFFLNVPVFMSWVFTFIKKLGIISPETLKKFQVQNNSNIASYFPHSELPSEYGGKTSSSLLKSIQVTTTTIPAYGKVILEKLNHKRLEESNLSVE